MTQRVPLLTVTCDMNYPGVMQEVTDSMEKCGAKTVGYQEKIGERPVLLDALALPTSPARTRQEA
jgi:predicted metallo-beta-lactamase superfamily hydrolase